MPNFFFRHLDVRLSKSTVQQNTNRETVVEIQESVRGKDVYIIQTGSKYVKNYQLKKYKLMSGSCHLDRAFDDKISVECLL